VTNEAARLLWHTQINIVYFDEFLSFGKAKDLSSFSTRDRRNSWSYKVPSKFNKNFSDNIMQPKTSKRELYSLHPIDY
jgi:hypothetical protein